MPIVRIDADQTTPAELSCVARALPDGAPIIAMIHGYRYSPASPAHDPHRHILSLNPDPALQRSLSWPRALGFGRDCPHEGLAIAFGWEARGSLRGAYARAADAGRSLGQMLSRLADQTGRPVALIGHSLGARVALQTLHHATPGSIARMILLAGAEFRDSAEAALNSPAGHQAEVINIASRENDVFDFAIEILLSRGRRRALGLGLQQPVRNWIDVQIDDDDTLRALDQLGFPVERDRLRLSHWTPYMRRGLFDFYQTALARPWAVPLPLLHQRLPGRTQPRWSRLLAPPVMTGGLRA